MNCRDKPLSSYVFYSQPCRQAYLAALSSQEVYPTQTDHDQISDNWTLFTDLRSTYAQMMAYFGKKFSMNTERTALRWFCSKIVSDSSGGPAGRLSRVCTLNPEELPKGLRKTTFTFCCELPESSEGLAVEVRDTLMEVNDSVEGKWEDIDPIWTVPLNAASRVAPSLGGVDVTATKPMTKEEIDEEAIRAAKSISSSEGTAKLRAAEIENKEQAIKKPRFTSPKVSGKKTEQVGWGTARASATAPAPAKATPAKAKAPPATDRSAAVEAPVPADDDDDDDMNDGATATDAPAQSAASTAACERITMMAPPVKTQARRFFRPSVVASNASSTMDYEAEDMLRRTKRERNPTAASFHVRPDRDQCQPLQRVLPPPDRSRDPGYTAKYQEQGRTRPERREPSSGMLDLPPPPPVPDVPEAPEYCQMLEQQRRGHEKGRKGKGKVKEPGKGKNGKEPAVTSLESRGTGLGHRSAD